VPPHRPLFWNCPLHAEDPAGSGFWSRSPGWRSTPAHDCSAGASAAASLPADHANSRLQRKGRNGHKALMKLLAASLILALSSPLASAFGPGPFSNGSPLATGTDGVYQAVATGTNLTGVFSWAILNGVQLADQANNGWTFFVDGNVVSGNTVANVAENSVSGILDPGANFEIPVDAGKKPILPYIKILLLRGSFEETSISNPPWLHSAAAGPLKGHQPEHIKFSL